jgi:hypothetical protein
VIRSALPLALFAAIACSRTTTTAATTPITTPPAPPPAPAAPAPPTPAPAPRGPFSVTTQGAPHALRFEAGAFLFCDGRGGNRLDLGTRRSALDIAACPARVEPNTACDGLPIDVTVRAPPSEPNDIVDVGGWSAPMNGHVRDCAASGKTLAVASGSAVALVDTAHEAIRVLSHEGADRVGIGAGWVAWSRGARIELAAIDGK